MSLPLLFLRSSDRDRFLRIIGESQGRRKTVIAPDSGLQAFASTCGIVSTISARTHLRCGQRPPVVTELYR